MHGNLNLAWPPGLTRQALTFLVIRILRAIKRLVSRPRSGTCLGFRRLIFPSQPHHTTSLTLSGTTCMALKCDRSTDPAVWVSMICGYLLTARWWSCTTMQWRGVSPTDQQPEFSLQSLDANVVVCRRWRMRGDSVSAGPHNAFQGRCHPRPARFAVSHPSSGVAPCPVRTFAYRGYMRGDLLLIKRAWTASR